MYKPDGKGIASWEVFAVMNQKRSIVERLQIFCLFTTYVSMVPTGV